jgi:anti-sigma factor RsiW
MPSDHSISDLLPAYVLGTLDQEETQQLNAHLAECVQCQAEMAAYQLVVDQLPLAVAEASPSRFLKQRLLNEVSVERQTAVSLPKTEFQKRDSWVARLQTHFLWKPAMIFVITLLVLGNVLLWRQIQQLQNPPTTAGMVAIAMTTTDAAPNASGFILVSVDGLSGAIIADDLPQLPADQQYQLWLFGNNDISAGAAFTVDALGYGGKWVNAPQSLHLYTHFNVTIESVDNDGKRPSGIIVFTGTFNSEK